MATAKKKAPAKKPKTDPSDPIRYQLTPSGQNVVSNFRNQPPTPKPAPIKISTTPKPLSAKDAQANAKAIAKFNKAEVRYAAKEVRANTRNAAKVARIEKQIAARANAGKRQPPQPRGGSGPSRGSSGSMGRGNMGGGLRKQGK